MVVAASYRLSGELALTLQGMVIAATMLLPITFEGTRAAASNELKGRSCGYPRSLQTIAEELALPR